MGKIPRGKGGDHIGVGRRVPQQKELWQSGVAAGK